DCSNDRLVIPLHIHDDGCFLTRRGMPFAVPGSRQRMPFLGQQRQRREGSRNNRTEYQDTPSHESSSRSPFQSAADSATNRNLHRVVLQLRPPIILTPSRRQKG